MNLSKVEIIKRLYRDYTVKHLKKIFIAIFFSILVAASTSGIAYLLDPAIEKIFINQDPSLMYIIPIIIIIAFFTKGFSLYLAKVIMIRVSQELKADVQKDMMKSLISTDTKFIDGVHTGKFISNLTLDVTLLVNLISTALLNIFKDSLSLIGLMAVMFFQNWKLSLVAIIMIPLATIVARTLGKRITKATKETMDTSALFTKRLVEIFKNHRIIKSFQTENFENERSSKDIKNLKEKAIKMTEIFTRNTPIMETLTGIMIAALIFYSGILIKNNELEINNFFSFLAAMMLAYQPVRSLAGLNISINQGISAAQRVLPIIDRVSEIKDDIQLPNLGINKGDIKFKDVSFHYDSKEIVALKSANISMDGGKMTALVGLSGAGKSTILSLIPRFYDKSGGDILIDGQSIYDCNLFSLRESISLVGQDTTLFDDTVKNNIKYAKLDASEDEIYASAKNSFAHDFIEKLPNKYDTLIGENGVRLSGGEKQRISIARAMLKKSPIILLDEATSSLDSETESKIQIAIKELTKNKTSVVIAHRLSTILNANKIYVIDSGKILENGTHDELLISSKTYKNFYNKQLRRD
ncbi:MAG: ABC transporter permease [Pelagibacterales bacterium MED-G41]|nr:MAG: ABC transporter permease [Pelagibacterales bacterium MED-G41]|tara:strand:- start:3297 stop:5042 length:1746 start_codon:yes stop_codon:yes gene_type:complete